jgi:hypothetical protein
MQCTGSCLFVTCNHLIDEDTVHMATGTCMKWIGPTKPTAVFWAAECA